MIESYAGELADEGQGTAVPLCTLQQVTSITDRTWPAQTREDVRDTANHASCNETWTSVQEEIRSIEFESNRSWFQEILERLIALICLLVFAPVMLAVALYIRMDSPGFPIFSQYRVGKKGTAVSVL